MKVLFVYPNNFLTTSIPLGIAYLSAVLKNNGIEVDLFDTTFYKVQESHHHKRERAGQVKSINWDFFDDVVKDGSNMLSDFDKKIAEFEPDLLAYSIVEDNWNLASMLMKSVNKLGIPTLAGGVFPSFAFNEKTITRFYNEVGEFNYCIGEGEQALLNLCTSSDFISNILAIKGKLVDINCLPIPDYDIFHPKMLYRPMGGKIRKTLLLETQRGCPYNCTFCNSQSQKALYKEERFYRLRNIEILARDLKCLINRHNPDFIYWVGDSFLSLSTKMWNDFCEMYQEFRLPFWMNTRPETIKKSRVRDLERIGCVRCSMGVEHGDYEFRKRVVKRNVTDEQIIEAAKCFDGSNIHLVINNIIGFPTETEELLQETISLNKKLSKYAFSSAFLFTPYHGIPLRDIAIKTGMISEDFICSDVWKIEDKINYQISPEQLQYIQNNFNDITHEN